MAYRAALIVIGNEILSGRTQDKNLSYLGKYLDKLGIRLLECLVVPDDTRRIVEALRDYKDRFAYVFTTGGIGPTHDDITRVAVAQGLGKRLLRHPEAVKGILSYNRGRPVNEARLKMADIPEGAILIENPISGAPGFQIENIFVLPGVPTIMQAMLPKLQDRLIGGDPIQTISITTNLCEGDFAMPLHTIQKQYTRVCIGSYPFFRAGRPGTNLVLRTADRDELEQAKKTIEAMIHDLDGQILD